MDVVEARLRMKPYWVALDEAIWSPVSLDNLLTDPWESSQSNILAAWESLTRPENLADLECWLAYSHDGADMSEWAEKVMRKAIEVCRTRAGGSNVTPAATQS